MYTCCIYIYTLYLSIYLSIYLSFFLSICLSIYLYLYLYLYLHIYIYSKLRVIFTEIGGAVASKTMVLECVNRLEIDQKQTKLDRSVLLTQCVMSYLCSSRLWDHSYIGCSSRWCCWSRKHIRTLGDIGEVHWHPFIFAKVPLWTLNWDSVARAKTTFSLAYISCKLTYIYI
jgi:hypothetical protein